MFMNLSGGSRLADPARPSPPPTPFRFIDLEEPEELSLVMTLYRGNYISAWDLESCLTDGFKLATSVIFEDGSTHHTPLTQHTWVCDNNAVEMEIVSEDPSLYDLTYFDLSMVLALISEFHQVYAMGNIAFNILGTRAQDYAQVGHGWVDLSPDWVRSSNRTVNGTASV